MGGGGKGNGLEEKEDIQPNIVYCQHCLFQSQDVWLTGYVILHTQYSTV